MTSKMYRVLFLGPKGSFSHPAAEKAVERLPRIVKERYGITCSATDFERFPLGGHEEIETRLREGHAFAVVPMSSSRRGDVYDYLPFFSYDLVDEFRVPVSFCLCSQSPAEKVRGLATKRIAYLQVKDEVHQILPQKLDLSLVTDDTSTSAGAEMAAEDPALAAICSEDAAMINSLSILARGLREEQTTFGVFDNDEPFYAPPTKIAAQYNHLTRASHVYAGHHRNAGRHALANLLERGKKLVVKWGVDPLYPSLHLGHLGNLLKLRDFLEYGHEVVVVMGSFTGVIGDPSGNLTRRPPVDEKVLQKNGELMLAQIKQVLSPYEYAVVWNDEYARDFDLRHFLKWMYGIDVRNMLSRPDFRNRFDFGYGLSVAEFVYPLFQALDTAQICPDIEIGGVDQLWNCLLMHDLLSGEGIQLPIILLVDEIKGIDGGAKMSSYEGNAIHFAESAEVIKEKLCGIPDGLLYHYFLALTRIDIAELHGMDITLTGGRLDADLWRQRLAAEIMTNLGVNTG